MVPNESPERFARACEDLCNILEERTVIYNFQVVDDASLRNSSLVQAITAEDIERAKKLGALQSVEMLNPTTKKCH